MRPKAKPVRRDQSSSEQRAPADHVPMPEGSTGALASCEMLLDVIDELPGMVFVKDLSGHILTINRNLERILGHSRDEVIGKTVRDLFSEERAEAYIAQDREVLESGHSVQREEFLDLPGGGRRFLVVTKFLLHDRESRPYAICGVSTDITEHKLLDEALQQSESRFRSLVETTSDWIWEIDAQGLYTYASPKVEDLLGYEPSEIIGRSPFDLMPPEESERISGLVTPLLEAGVPFSGIRNLNRHKDGRLIWLETSAVPVRDADGNLCGFRGIDRDVMERKSVEDELRLSAERLRLAQAAADAGAWELNLDTSLASWSEECHRLFGVEPSNPDPLGTWMTRIHPEDLDQVQQAIDQCAKQGGVEVAYRYQHPDRGRRWILSKARTMQHTDGRDRIFGVSIDITRVKRLEEDLRQVRDDLERRVRARTAQLSRTVEALHAEVAQRVEAEEALQNRSQQLRLLSTELTLAEQKERQRMSQVLHDGLQQLLVGTRFQLGHLERSTADAETRRAAHQISALIEESIEISRSLTAELSPPALHLGLSPALEWLADWMAERHGLIVQLRGQRSLDSPAEDVTILLFQAVRELLFNVVKHAGVKTAQVDMSQKDGSLRLVVSDSGVGFDPARLRAEGGSSFGVGLFAVRERLNLLGGRMEVKSSPGQGSRITLAAPLAHSSEPGS